MAHDALVAALGIGCAKDRRTRHEGISTRGSDLGDVFHLDAAIDLEPDWLTPGCHVRIDPRPDRLQLFKRGIDEALASETWIHRHEQNDVEPMHYMVEVVEWCCRIENQTCPTAVVANQLERAIDMVGRFGVKSDEVGTGLGEISCQTVYRADHQVNIDRNAHMRADGLTHHRPHGEIGHVVVIHHIEVDQVGASGLDGAHFLAQAGEIGRQEAWCDAK